jgi:hypothetical protein
MMKRLIFFILCLTASGTVFARESALHPASLQFLNSDARTGATQGKWNTLSQAEKAVRVLEIFHIGLGAVAYGSLISDTAVGTALGVLSVQDPAYFNDNQTGYRFELIRWHRALMLTSYISYGLSAILSYISLGIKIYHKIPVNLPHFIASIVTTALYVLGIGSMIITYEAFVPGSSSYVQLNPYARQIGWIHGSLFYAMTLSFTVTLIMIPAGSGRKMILGVKTI